MRGSIRQRGDAWELRVYVGRDPVTGKDRYKTATHRGPRREAERALAHLIVEADVAPTAETTVTMGELLERWFAHVRNDFSPSTVLETRGILDRELHPNLGALRLDKVRAQDLDAYYRRLRTSGSRGRPLAPATIRRIHGIARRALEQGVRWGWLSLNPAAAASPPRVPKRPMRPPTPEQLHSLLTRARTDDPELATFIALAAASGARRSELIALRWNDLDLPARRLTIERGVVVGIDGTVEKDTKTHQARVITLDARTCADLARHHRLAESTAAAVGVALAPEAYVFSADAAGRVGWFPDSASRRFRKLCRRAGLQGVRLHDLRHYVATRLLANGVDVRTVAGRLGHRSAATTLNVYAHFVPAADARAADILASLLDIAPTAVPTRPPPGPSPAPEDAAADGSAARHLHLVVANGPDVAHRHGTDPSHVASVGSGATDDGDTDQNRPRTLRALVHGRDHRRRDDHHTPPRPEPTDPLGLDSGARLPGRPAAPEVPPR